MCDAMYHDAALRYAPPLVLLGVVFGSLLLDHFGYICLKLR